MLTIKIEETKKGCLKLSAQGGCSSYGIAKALVSFLEEEENKNIKMCFDKLYNDTDELENAFIKNLEALKEALESLKGEK